jgi:hypothetical protein
VPVALRAQMFDPLVEQQAVRPRPGLPTAKALIENQGGSLRCTSAAAGGTELVMELPVSPRPRAMTQGARDAVFLIAERAVWSSSAKGAARARPRARRAPVGRAPRRPCSCWWRRGAARWRRGPRRRRPRSRPRRSPCRRRPRPPRRRPRPPRRRPRPPRRRPRPPRAVRVRRGAGPRLAPAVPVAPHPAAEGVLPGRDDAPATIPACACSRPRWSACWSSARPTTAESRSTP